MTGRSLVHELEGGCRVRGLRDSESLMHGALRIWPVVGRETGAQHVSLRLLEFAHGSSPLLSSADCDDVWYVLEGQGTLQRDGRELNIESANGIYLAPGSGARVHNAAQEPLVVVSVRCPEPRATGVIADAGRDENASTMSARRGTETAPDAVPIVRLADRAREATGDRWYQVVIDRAVGSSEVTQFVGCIPPGRAPDHFHHYEEVIVILEGQGRMWAGNTSAPVGPGSCIYLPVRQVHCLENTGDGPLLLLGVFYPSGSPAARYDAAGS